MLKLFGSAILTAVIILSVGALLDQTRGKNIAVSTHPIIQTQTQTHP